jgi:hypothetical protein
VPQCVDGDHFIQAVSLGGYAAGTLQGAHRDGTGRSGLGSGSVAGVHLQYSCLLSCTKRESSQAESSTATDTSQSSTIRKGRKTVIFRRMRNGSIEPYSLSSEAIESSRSISLKR